MKFPEIAEIIDAEGWDLIICGVTNVSVGHFTNNDTYVESGYEAKVSRFAVGVAECIIEYGKQLPKDQKSKNLKILHNNKLKR